MADNTRAPNQQTRLFILLLYLAGLMATSYVVFDSCLPPTSEKGLWFYSAAAALLLGNLIVTPFFTKPSDAIAYAVAGLVAILAVNVWKREDSSGFDRFLWTVVFFHIAVVVIAGVASISLKDSTMPWRKRLADSMAVLCDRLGSPRAVFSSVFLFALVTFHRDNPTEYVVIGLAWVLFVGLRPLESFAGLLSRLRGIWTEVDLGSRIGTVVSHDAPSVVLVREDLGTTVSVGDSLVARSDTGQVRVALALDHVGYSDGRWLRALHFGEDLSDFGDRKRVIYGDVYKVEVETLGERQGNTTWAARDRLVGLTAPNTTVSILHVEVTRTDLSLFKGALLEVTIAGKRVLYQIIDGKTREEILNEKNTRGFVRAEAKKIGSWDSVKEEFKTVPWLPHPNSPVFLAESRAPKSERGAVGFFPGTAYPVRLDCNYLVSHNTAILGILGVGKSFLALELVERMIDDGIKVICLDLTDQYATELSEFFDESAQDAKIEALQTIGEIGKSNVSKHVEEGGSAADFAAEVRNHLREFLDPNSEERIRILNPVRFTVWRQDSKPFNNEASMATLTPCEITRIITEGALEVLQEQGMTSRARCCILYEEAHSLIPEWNAVASEGDKSATNGTAKAILQGRKFGLGCVVVTQRTANVTKSILNQCNTVFALRVFDATGIDFLKNYIGEDYAGVLSTLEDRHAVVFGRASSCRDPVLVRLNNRSDFVREFRGA